MAKTAIIADDAKGFRGFLVDFLQSSAPGATIDEVPDGESLVKKVMGGEYSLVLTDYDMGSGMTGEDAIRAKRV